jgi:Uma2 family endonuclease
MGTVRPRIPYTYEDYKSLPESMDRRYELLQGELYMVPAPTTDHQRLSRNLGFVLFEHCRAQRLGEILFSPVDVVFGEGRAREVAQPDIVFIAAERRSIVTRAEIAGAPDLVVEVLSPGTEDRDRNYKKTLYQRYGVQEYWIVDPDARTLERYVLTPGGYGAPEPYAASDGLGSPLFPGLVIALPEVFGA